MMRVVELQNFLRKLLQGFEKTEELKALLEDFLEKLADSKGEIGNYFTKTAWTPWEKHETLKELPLMHQGDGWIFALKEPRIVVFSLDIPEAGKEK